jgi:hypothetical protein
MSAIPDGYRLAVMDAEGLIADTVEIGGVDLRRPLARELVCAEISDVVARHEKSGARA